MEDPRLDIDPDISRAWTPPAALYTDPGLYARQLQEVFAPAWHALVVAAPPGFGEARAQRLLPGSLDEPLLHTRDATGVERLLSNVCTHRGHVLCDEAARGDSLQCRYHGRRFGLDGGLLAAPGFEGAHAFPSPSDDLPRLPLERVGPLSFTCVQPERSLAEWFAGAERVLPLLEREHVLHAEQIQDFEVEAHWALYVDNYLEGFHIPFVHPELAGTLAAGSYRSEALAHGVLQVGEAAEGEPAFQLPVDHPDAARRIAAYYLWLLPGTMLNVYPWGISLNVVEPLGPGRTRVRFVPYVAEPELRGRGAGGALELVEEQDERVVEAVARGLRARLYGRGRYAPAHEVGVHHFHRLLAERLDRRSAFDRPLT